MSGPGLLPNAVPSGPLWRVGRASKPCWFSQISPEIDALNRAGNRFDVLGSGVMYAASTRLGALAETLQGFRPTTTVRAAVKRLQPGLMSVGAIPADWREQRRLVHLELVDPIPFLDLEHPRTWPILEDALAAELADLTVPNLDVSVIRGPSRRLTRLIATWAYLQDDPGSACPRFGGIRYLSKLGDHECWAIFAGGVYHVVDQLPIEANDPDYLAACRAMELVPH